MLISTLALLASVMEPSGHAAGVRFAPFVVRVTMDIAHGRRVSGCTVQTEGDPDAHWLDNPCGNIADPTFLGDAGLDENAAGHVTVLLRMEANGAATSRDTPPGTLTSRTSISFDVGPDGAVTRCDREERTGDGQEFPLCLGFPPGPTPFEAATHGEAARAGRLSLSFYLAR